jgi:serine protease Do
MMNATIVLAFLLPQADALERLLPPLRERVAPSVVALEVARTEDPHGKTGGGAVAAHRDFFNRPAGPCSGVIYEPDGFILTSYFNVSGKLRERGLKVTLADGTVHEAKLLGHDEGRDIALLKIEADGLPVLPKADLSKVAQGTFVAIVGRAPDKEHPTIGCGIVSAVNRMRNTAVQTDASMNYGNSGGALVTLRGELVGVGAHIAPRARWGQSSGVGFACKVTEIDGVLERLKKGEKIAAPKMPFLGIRPGEGNPDVEGVEVSLVVPGAPAEKAGIKGGDVIVALDGAKVTDFESLRTLLAAKKIGDEVTVRVMRKGEDGKYAAREFKVKLGERSGP